jgi:hypothetical protein
MLMMALVMMIPTPIAPSYLPALFRNAARVERPRRAQDSGLIAAANRRKLYRPALLVAELRGAPTVLASNACYARTD